MAIDPRISLAVQAPNVSRALDIFERTKQGVANREAQAAQTGIAQAQETRAAEMAPLQKQQVEQVIAANELAAQQATENRILKSVNDFAVMNAPLINRAVQSGDPKELQQALIARKAQLTQQGLPTDQTDNAILMLGQGNIQGVVDEMQGAVSLYNQAKGQTAGQREFAGLTKGLSQEDINRAKRISLGLDPRASISATERIATDEVLGKKVATQAGVEAGATEGAKLGKQLKHKPTIAKAVKLAEKAATERGEVLTDLARMEASLPGVKEAVGELLELSDAATSTLGGRAFDFLVKESGFGSTKGADARAKLVAIVDNQVLPLLKETFGAAFTVQEGENLKASLVDPNASPSQKREQINAFLAQKERNIRTKQTQLGESQNVQLPTGGMPVDDVDLSSLSIEELMAERQRLGGQ